MYLCLVSFSFTFYLLLTSDLAPGSVDLMGREHSTKIREVHGGRWALPGGDHQSPWLSLLNTCPVLPPSSSVCLRISPAKTTEQEMSTWSRVSNYLARHVTQLISGQMETETQICLLSNLILSFCPVSQIQSILLSTYNF